MGIVIYTKTTCPYCYRAKELLNNKSVPYQEITIDNNEELRAEMQKRSGQHTVPQIFFGKQHVGGCDDLYALENSGKLDKLLENFK